MHLVETMAYINKVPWHGLGRRLAAEQPIEVWAERAGMNWRIEASDVRFDTGSAPKDGLVFPGQKVLYRSDTNAPLAIVSDRYQVVQPSEILEFYRDLIDIGGFELETAGVLKEGKKFWALARTGQSVVLKGRDQVDGYLLLATACDGTLATTAQFTSVRVVCQNTLAVALGKGAGAIKVPHRSHFDAQAVKRQLGVAVASWDEFMMQMKAMSECRVSAKTTEAFLQRVLTYPAASAAEQRIAVINDRAMKVVQELFAGRGMGASFGSAANTAWGLVNSVTEFVDHHRRARSDDHRLDAAWFGQGAELKRRAWLAAVSLVE
jgi:phage/plasmid-like protein (TIGR03299 family)